MASNKIHQMVVAALLCAIGILIPMFSPVKVIIEPASFTLASHVAIFVGAFISPAVAIAVAIGTTIGFSFSFPIVVVMRSATHVIFATILAILIKHYPNILKSKTKTFVTGFFISIIHAASELAVVMPFYFGGKLSSANYNKGFLFSIILLVGFGTIIHSMIDFYLAYFIWKPLNTMKKIGV